METNQLLCADFLDILFEGRNKEYGAYELRKTYNKRITIALLTMLSFCTVIFLASIITKSKAQEKLLLNAGAEVTLVNADPIPPPVIPPPVMQPAAQRPVATIKFTTPVLINQDVVPPPKQAEISNIAISNITQQGDDKTDFTAPPAEAHDIGKAVAPVINNFEHEVFFVQQKAQFPGGATAWTKFLEKNLKSELPAENGATIGTFSVVVSFLVDKDGNISEVKAETDPGYGTAAEAVRVISRGPKWIPAVQNGQKVIYRQRQIITFKVDDSGN